MPMSSNRLHFRILIGTLFLSLAALPLFAQDAPVAPPNAVVQGTVFLIQLTDRLDTHNIKAGDHFHARLAEPLTAEDGITLNEGRKITGHVSAVEPGFRTRVLLSFDEIET